MKLKLVLKKTIKWKHLLKKHVLYNLLTLVNNCYRENLQDLVSAFLYSNLLGIDNYNTEPVWN